MFNTLRRGALALAFCFALTPAAQAGWSSLDVAGEKVDIYRDDYGRPHIFATTAFAAFMSRRFGEVGGTELTNQQLLTDLITAKGLSAAVGIFNDVRWLVDPNSPATIPDTGANGPRPHEPRSPHASQLRALSDLPANNEADAKK